MKNNYIFEILVIDKNGQTSITTGESLVYGLLFSESLWKKKEVIKVGDTQKIVDSEQQVELKFQSVDTSSTLNDLIEAAFVIRIKGENYIELENFRFNFLVHLRRKLNFTNIRILRDDISTKISNEIYPLINQVENLLRRYLVKFFTQKIGVDWWEVTAPKQFSEKINSRKGNEKVFSTLADTDVTLIDFDDLGELIYKQTTGFNKQENIIARVMNSNTQEELNILKQELQGNYTKYFKEAFQDNNFEKKWKTLFEIRNKVAHNNLFIHNDLEVAKQLVTDLTEIINSAETKIDEFKFSIEDQEALRQATIDAYKVAEIQNESKEKELEQLGVKVLGKIDLPTEYYQRKNSLLIITEEELLEELENAESRINERSYLPFVPLKSFVTKNLGNKGYSYGPTYSLVNILKDKGIIEIFDPMETIGMELDNINNGVAPKGIRIVRK
jgi:uncharacterized protein with HEPN domain